MLVLGAGIVGAAAGALTYRSSRSLASAVFTGAGAFAAAPLWFDHIVAPSLCYVVGRPRARRGDPVGKIGDDVNPAPVCIPTSATWKRRHSRI